MLSHPTEPRPEAGADPTGKFAKIIEPEVEHLLRQEVPAALFKQNRKGK
jgi:hypothetical protein